MNDFFIEDAGGDAPHDCPACNRAIDKSQSFADAPMSIAEARAHKENDASRWSPRDALISMLRDIDAGKMAVARMVIAYDDGDGIGTLSAGVGPASDGLGMLARAMHGLNQRADQRG